MRRLLLVLAPVALLSALALPANPAGATLQPGVNAKVYVTASGGPWYLALGDSLAAGVGAPAGQGYVDDIYDHEKANFPGLQLENLGCPGETTTSMISGGVCTFTAGNQLAQAEAFLSAHPGQVAFVTMDIGANDIDGCASGGSINVQCVLNGLKAIQTNMPTILHGLTAAYPGKLNLFGMDYYDPFLAYWLNGSSGQSLAKLTTALVPVLNGDLQGDYAAYGAPTADVQAAFATMDFATMGTYNGHTYPLNVARICNWTLMCVAGNIHTNPTGHAVLASTFDALIDRVLFRGGGRGLWLVGGDGGVFSFGTARFFGSMGASHLNAAVLGMAATSDGGGYWLVGADGGVFAFGDAHFVGSLAGQRLSSPIIGIAGTPDNRGYWLAAADGSVYAFGDAPPLGGVPSSKAAHLVGILGSPSGFGYNLIDGSGRVFGFGDAVTPGQLSNPAPVTAAHRDA